MLEPGTNYFEIIRTGKLSFDDYGNPRLTPTEHYEVFRVDDLGFFEKLTVAKESFNSLQPNKIYFRVFVTPTISFDKDGEAMGGRCETSDFYEVNADLVKAVNDSFDIDQVDLLGRKELWSELKRFR